MVDINQLEHVYECGTLMSKELCLVAIAQCIGERIQAL